MDTVEFRPVCLASERQIIAPGVKSPLPLKWISPKNADSINAPSKIPGEQAYGFAGTVGDVRSPKVTSMRFPGTE
jgi:hypothetical protein